MTELPKPLVAPTAVRNEFKYFTYDLLTGRLLSQIPFESVSFESVLNSAGKFSGQIKMSDPRVQTTEPIQATVPNRTLIAVDYQGQIIWAGVVTARKRGASSSTTSTTRTFTVEAAELWTWFGSRVQATDYSAPPYSGITGASEMSLWKTPPWDASLIACQVIGDAIEYTESHTEPYTNILNGLLLKLNGATPSAASPPAPERDRVAINYPFTNMQTISTIVQQLSELGLGVGFDFGIDVAYEAGPGTPPVGTINISYPRRGRKVTESNLMVNLQTARSYEFPEDGTQTAIQVYELGGSGAIAVDLNVFPLNQGYPIWERVMSRATIQSQHIEEVLTQIGTSDLAVYSYAPVVPTVVLAVNDPNLPLGTFKLGDDIRLFMPKKIQNSSTGVWEYFDEGFPEGLDQEWRITMFKVEVKDEGESLVTYTLNQPPFEQALEPAL